MFIPGVHNECHFSYHYFNDIRSVLQMQMYYLSLESSWVGMKKMGLQVGAPFHYVQPQSSLHS